LFFDVLTVLGFWFASRRFEKMSGLMMEMDGGGQLISSRLQPLPFQF
jgi:hypothetical protein